MKRRKYYDIILYIKESDNMNEYIIVKTLCDDKQIVEKISKDLLLKHLVSGTQISTVESTYWWNNKIESSTEYLLEVRTKKSLFKEVEEIIKKIHPYEVCEISYYEINGSKEFLNWIEVNTK